MCSPAPSGGLNPRCCSHLVLPVRVALLVRSTRVPTSMAERSVAWAIGPRDGRDDVQRALAMAARTAAHFTAGAEVYAVRVRPTGHQDQRLGSGTPRCGT